MFTIDLRFILRSNEGNDATSFCSSLDGYLICLGPCHRIGFSHLVNLSFVVVDTHSSVFVLFWEWIGDGIFLFSYLICMDQNRLVRSVLSFRTGLKFCNGSFYDINCNVKLLVGVFDIFYQVFFLFQFFIHSFFLSFWNLDSGYILRK